MGYGVWNPSLLEDDSRALHVAYAKAEDESDEDEVDFVRQCDEEDMLAAADSIAAAFDIEVDEREGWYKSHGDRYQFLRSRFEIDKAGLFYQQEPFMGRDLCFVVTPIYTLDSDHAIWRYDDKEFHAEYGISPEKYRSIAWKQAQHLEEMLIAALIDDGHEIHAGGGYMMDRVEPSTTFAKAKSSLMASLPKKMQQAIRHQRRYGEALSTGRSACTSTELWF